MRHSYSLRVKLGAPPPDESILAVVGQRAMYGMTDVLHRHTVTENDGVCSTNIYQLTICGEVKVFVLRNYRVDQKKCPTLYEKNL